MKKIGLFLMSLMAIAIMSSCSPMVYADYVVTSSGVPYYNTSGVLLYYEYRDMYYYPYYINGVCHYRAYRTLQPHLHQVHHPHPSHRAPSTTHFSTPNRKPNARPSNRPSNNRPNVRPSSRPTAKPNQQPNRRPSGNTNVRRTNTSPTRNITRFGGRR